MPDPTRQDWLLRFIAGTPTANGPVDVIRMMKGLFLFQEESKPPPAVNYSFRPYDYGPFTPEIYRDAEYLEREGLVKSSDNNRAYAVTAEGLRRLVGLSFDPHSESDLLTFRREVSRLSFRSLLRRVYKAHPASAERSVAKDILGDVSSRPNQ